MNKKGITYFMPLLTICILLLLTVAFIKLVQIDVEAEPIGIRQQAILETYQESIQQRIYAEVIIEQAIQTATTRAISTDKFKEITEQLIYEQINNHPLARLNGETEVTFNTNKVTVEIKNNKLPVLLTAAQTTIGTTSTITSSTPSSTSSITTRDAIAEANYNTVLQKLQTERDPRTGKTLYDLLIQISEEENFDDLGLALAMVIIESHGDIKAHSEIQAGGGGDVCGLLQVTRDAANRFLGTSYTYKPDCEDREWATPERQIRAALRYIEFLSDRYDGPHKIRFAGAAYNGGEGAADIAYRRYRDDYERAILSLTVDDFRSVGFGSVWTDSRLVGPLILPETGKTKIEEMLDHGNSYATNYEIGGGHVVPSFVTTNRIGLYTYDVGYTTTYNNVRIQQAEDFIRDLKNCVGAACQSTIANLENLFGTRIPCSNEVEEYGEIISACAKKSANNLCACELSTPTSGIDHLEISGSAIGSLDASGIPISASIDIVGKDLDPRPKPAYGYYPSADPLAFIGYNDIIFLRREVAIWSLGYDTTPSYDKVPVLNKWYIHPKEHPSDTIPDHILKLTDAPPLGVPICSVTQATKYCFGEQVSFWVTK